MYIWFGFYIKTWLLEIRLKYYYIPGVILHYIVTNCLDLTIEYKMHMNWISQVYISGTLFVFFKKIKQLLKCAQITSIWWSHDCTQSCRSIHCIWGTNSLSKLFYLKWRCGQTSCISHNILCTTVTQHRIDASVQLGKGNIVKKMELNHMSLSWKH
jgi:hypothetical protein